MILVRKNVYKDVDLLKCFQFCKMFESVYDCFENSKDVFVLKIARMFCFEFEQVTRNILPTQKSFLCFFTFPFG